MNIKRLMLNEKSYFGPKAREKVITELEANNYKKVLVVTDKVLLDNKVSTKVLEELDSHFIPYEVYSNIKPNPTVKNVIEGVEKCKAVEADCLIAVGGGSVIDTAKAIGIIMTNSEFEDVISLEGTVTRNKSLPIIALPTTAGTAAEVTINYVITDEEREKKMVLIDSNVIPSVTIVDTDLLKEMPSSLAAYTGMDALTHAMEGYITKNAWPMSDMFHQEAIRLITENIIPSVLEKKDEAIEMMGMAQYIAGMGFSNAGLGLVHSMAHALGAVYDMPHGLANAVLLPYVLKYNGPSCPVRFRRMGALMGLNTINCSDEEAVFQVCNKVFELNRMLNIPIKLHEIGVHLEDLEKLSTKAFDDACTEGNPKSTSPSEILEIFKEAF